MYAQEYTVWSYSSQLVRGLYINMNTIITLQMIDGGTKTTSTTTPLQVLLATCMW